MFACFLGEESCNISLSNNPAGNGNYVGGRILICGAFPILNIVERSDTSVGDVVLRGSRQGADHAAQGQQALPDVVPFHRRPLRALCGRPGGRATICEVQQRI